MAKSSTWIKSIVSIGIVCAIVTFGLGSAAFDKTGISNNRIIAHATDYPKNTADCLVDVAQKELGNTHGSKYSGLSDDVSWCAYFASWCAKQAGVTSVPTNGGAGTLRTAMINAGCKEVTSPQKGDYVFYHCKCKCSNCNKGKDTVMEHVGIMINSKESIEGNRSSKVKLCDYGTYAHYCNGNTHSEANGYIKRYYVRPNYKNTPKILPGTIDNTYNVPIEIKATKTISTYDEYGIKESDHFISKNDTCYITEVYTNKYVKLKYPITDGYRWAYASVNDFALSKYTDIGTDFYAYIKNSDKPIMQGSDSYVVLMSASKADKNSTIWHFVRNSDGTYKIESYKNKKVLDVQKAVDENGTKVLCYESKNNDNQHWYIFKNSDGTYKLKAKFTSRYLDVKGASSADGTVVEIYNGNDSAAQKFKIEKVTLQNVCAHSYGSWSTTKAATCTEDGTQTRKCSACSKTETKTIAKTGHNYIEKVIAPTSLEQGYTLHTCSVCGDSYKDNYKPKLDAPKFTTQPQNATVSKAGDIAAFTVTATGTGLKYAWFYRDSTSDWKKTSVTTNKYSVVVTEARHGRQMYCEVTDKYGVTVKSNVVTMRIGEIADITSQPKSVTVGKAGDVASFTIAAEGADLKYAWFYRDGTSAWKKTSVTTNKYSIVVTEARNGRQMYCEVTNKYGNIINSNVVTMKIADAPKFTSQPKSVTVGKAGDTAAFTVTATGTGLKYAWFYRDGTSAWKKTSVTTNKYSIVVTEARHGRQMYCEVTDKYGVAVKSNVVTMRIGETANITSQPKNATVGKAGDIASFTIAAEGTGLKYAWFYRDGTSAWKKTSVTTNKYSIVVTEARNGRQMYCEVTNKYGNIINSNVVTMKIGK